MSSRVSEFKSESEREKKRKVEKSQERLSNGCYDLHIERHSTNQFIKVQHAHYARLTYVEYVVKC